MNLVTCAAYRRFHVLEKLQFQLTFSIAVRLCQDNLTFELVQLRFQFCEFVITFLHYWRDVWESTSVFRNLSKLLCTFFDLKIEDYLCHCNLRLRYPRLSTYFEFFANLFPDGFFKFLETIWQTRFGQIFIKIFVAEFIENGIFDVFILNWVKFFLYYIMPL